MSSNNQSQLFKLSFAFAVIFLIINIKMLTGMGFSNALEKFFFLITAGLLLFRTKNKDVLLILSAIIIVTLIAAMFSQNPLFSWGVYFKAITQILIVFLLCAGLLYEAEQKFILKFCAWLPPLMVLISLFYTVAGLHPIFSFEYVSGLPRLQLTLIPAFLGGLSIATTYAALKYSDRYNYRYLWLFAFNVVILLLSSARGPLIISLLLSIYVFFAGFKGQKNLKVLVIMLTALGLSTIVLVAGDVIFGRLLQSHLSGRDIIWEHLSFVSSIYPNFGVGFGHQIYFMPRDVTALTGGTIGAHNEFLRILVEIGRVPTYIFFSCFFLLCYIVSINTRTKSPAEILIAGSLFLLYCTFDNVITNPNLFLFFIVVFWSNSSNKVVI